MVKKHTEVAPAEMKAVGDVFFPERLPAGKLCLLWGEGDLTSLVLRLAAGRLAGGKKMLVLDGGNWFNPYVISRAVRLVDARADEVLEHLLVSRAFTCHQMETAVREELGKAFARCGASVAIVLGLLETFYDEAVARAEAERLLNRLLGTLHGLVKEGRQIIVVERPPRGLAKDRLSFLWRLRRTAQVSVFAEERAGRLLLFQEIGDRLGLSSFEMVTNPSGKI